VEIEPIHEYKVMIVNKTTNKKKTVIVKSTNIELAHEEVSKLYKDFFIKDLRYNWLFLREYNK
jgi:UDP-glucose 6-dehydrogenase